MIFDVKTSVFCVYLKHVSGGMLGKHEINKF